FTETFGRYVTDDPETGKATIDFKDPAAAVALSKTLLLRDFGLQWEVPLDRLCPPIPNRLNYICWLGEIMELGQEDVAGAEPGARNETLRGAAGVGDDEGERAGGGGKPGKTGGEVSGEQGFQGGASSAHSPPRTQCRGVDIGTGASCIYPLLGWSMHGWSFLATETDPTSAEWAAKNVERNSLQGEISVRLVAPHEKGSGAPGPLRGAIGAGDGSFDFCMTNPPFFELVEEGGQNPDTATRDMATEGELSCRGGEVDFVRAIVEDSLILKERVRWYTTMVGRKASAKKILGILREAGVRNVRSTEFFQGRTVRWGIAWSFSSEGMVSNKVPDDPSVKVFSKKKMLQRSRNESAVLSFCVVLRGGGGSKAMSAGGAGGQVRQGGRAGG
ncbi:unnamed protein product, partial [Discosporangium mesarthrocarpum]